MMWYLWGCYQDFYIYIYNFKNILKLNKKPLTVKLMLLKIINLLNNIYKIIITL